MIITKKQLRKAIVSNKYIPFADHDLIFSLITSKKRWMWETELIRWEQLYLKCYDIRSVPTSAFCKTIHHDCKTHNTDHAV